MSPSAHLECRVYRSPMTSGFPERNDPRCDRDLAVAISGGAGRSLSAAIGQVRGLMDLGRRRVGHWSVIEAKSLLEW